MHQLVSGLTTVLQELADQGIADVANHLESWLLAKTALRGHLSAEEQNKADFDFGELFHWRHPRSTHSAPAAVVEQVVEPAVEPAADQTAQLAEGQGIQAQHLREAEPAVDNSQANSQGETQNG